MSDHIVLLSVADGPEGIEIYTSEERGVVDWSPTFPAVYASFSISGASFQVGPFTLPSIYRQLVDALGKPVVKDSLTTEKPEPASCECAVRGGNLVKEAMEIALKALRSVPTGDKQIPAGIRFGCLNASEIVRFAIKNTDWRCCPSTQEWMEAVKPFVGWIRERKQMPLSREWKRLAALYERMEAAHV